MDYNILDKVVAEPTDLADAHPQQVFGGDHTSGHLIVRSSRNEELLYLDGACEGQAPIFIGLTKSRGTQSNKTPIKANDMLGGLQVYPRIKQGSSLGYCQEETPLSGAIQFKVSNEYQGGNIVPTEMLIALTDTEGMSIKLKLDSRGNLIVANSIQLGELTITDTIVKPTSQEAVYVKAIHNGIEYAIPMYPIR